jgi:bacitracin synthase 3
VKTRVLQNLSHTFDFGVFEILSTFLSGGCLFILNKSLKSDFYFYPQYINSRQINTIHCTPIFLNNLADPGQKMPSLMLLHLGGEQLTASVVMKIMKLVSPHARLYNGYGPTEASINCTYFYVNKDEIEANVLHNIPIGSPSDQHKLYILDKYGNPQPVGAAGELCIAGPGLSAGYLNRPELTAERFKRNVISQWSFVNGKSQTDNNFLNLTNDQCPMTNDYFYCTGDLARWLPNASPTGGGSGGVIEFLGRIDHQVKVRGFRIELGEIEDKLAHHPLIKEVVVLARQHENGSNFLAAYIVTQENIHLTVSELREFLGSELPDYMIPAYFISLEKFPLTGTGKIDRKALPEPDLSFIDTGTEFIAPTSETEKRLVSIWQQILGLEKIGIMDDFFQLGGDSILVNRCIALIREELQVEIPLRKFFEKPFIKALAEEIVKKERQVDSIKPVERKGEMSEIPLSFAQERLWFLQELDAGNVAYFVPRVIRITGNLEPSLIERTFSEIIRRHEILRTVFPTVEGQPVQRIKPPFLFKIPFLDWSNLEKNEQEKKVAQFLSEEDHRAFDFEKGPLLRVTIIKLKAEEHLFVLT